MIRVLGGRQGLDFSSATVDRTKKIMFTQPGVLDSC